MKSTRFLRASSAAVLSAAFLLALTAASRADLVYKVNLAINQADLTSSAGPFSLDFELATGSGAVLNTVTLSNFQVTGGTFTSGTEGNSGSGNITGSLLNTPASLFLSNGYSSNLQQDNEDWVAFSSGVTNISFIVDETNRGGQQIPDTFSVAVLDNGLNYIPTSGTSNFLVYGTSAMDSVNSLSLGNSSDAGGVATTAAIVPEPGSAVLLLLGVAGVVARRKRNAAPQVA